MNRRNTFVAVLAFLFALLIYAFAWTDGAALATAPKPTSSPTPGLEQSPDRVDSPEPRVASPTQDVRTTVAESPVAPDPAEAAQGPHFEVFVLGLEGKPAPGATVQWDSGIRQLEGITDEGGLARFALPTSIMDIGLQASRGGLVAIPRRVRSDDSPVTLQLKPTEQLRVRILDSRSRDPVPGASIRISAPGNSFRQTVISDGLGEFTLEGIPKGTNLYGSFTAQGYAMQSFKVSSRSEAEGPTPTLEVLVDSAVSVTGRVLDAITAEPIPRATLKASPTGWMKSARTEEDGRFEFQDLLPQGETRLELKVSAPGYVGIMGVLDRANWSESITLRLVPAARLEFHPMDPGGAPIQGATLSTPTPHPWQPADTPPELDEWLEEEFRFVANSSDPFGRPDYFRKRSLEHFRIPYSPPLRYTLEARGHETVEGTLPVAGEPGSDDVLEVVMTPRVPPEESTRIQGRLTINGEPAAGKISWTVGDKQRFGAVEKDGTFLLNHVTPGRATLQPHPKLLGTEGFGDYFSEGMPLGDHRLSVETSAGQLTEVEFEISLPLGTLTGRIIESTGEPVAGQWVRVESIPWPLPLQRSYPPRPRPLASGRTDGLGQYSIEVPLALAPFRVSLEHGSETRSIDAPTAPTSGLDFHLERTRPVVIRAHYEFDAFRGQPIDVHLRAHPSPSYRRVPENRRLRTALDLGPRSPIPFVCDLPLGTYDFLIGNPLSLPVMLESVEVTDEDTPLELEAEIPLGHRVEIVLLDGVDPIPEDYTVLLLEERHWNAVHDPELVGGHGSPYPAAKPIHARSVRFNQMRSTVRTAMLPGSYRFKVFPPDITIEPEWIEMGSSDLRVEIRWE